MVETHIYLAQKIVKLQKINQDIHTCKKGNKKRENEHFACHEGFTHDVIYYFFSPLVNENTEKFKRLLKV